jgi:hypothetical protein
VCEEDEQTTCVLNKKKKKRKTQTPSVSERDSRDFRRQTVADSRARKETHVQ